MGGTLQVPHRVAYARSVGVLKHEPTGRRATLAVRSLVGRVDGCAVRLVSRRASGEHAVLFWNGSRWSVRDLGSTNGTRASGRRLSQGERAHLEAGAELVFGDDTERWTLEEAGPPAASARSEATGEVRAAEDGLLALPGAADPRVTLFEDRDGRWRIEIDGIARLAADQERVDAGGIWTLRVPPLAHGGAVPTTASAAAGAKLVGATGLRFKVSRDEEHIALSLVHGGRQTPLAARAHHEMLLALARERLRDRDAGVPAAEQGWVYVDDLLTMLRLDLHHLNVNVFRARQQLARAGVLDVGALVERRPATRQIRLGTDEIEILSP